MRKSKQCVIFLPLILSICYGITMAVDSACGDWEAYKSEKCFKVSGKYGTEEEAEKTCNQEGNSATLAIISSKDEQDFLSNLLFKTHKIVDNVWIGAKHTSNKFKWIDDSDLSFTNWAVGSPQNETGYDCVQMIPDASSMGKWINEPCGRNNLVVCQKVQNWPISLLQKTLLDTTKKLQDTLEDTRNQLKNLQQNLVPIGFIYVQLPNQKAPNELWPGVVWDNVTPKYAGHFFRAEGGNAISFGNGSQIDAFQGHKHSIQHDSLQVNGGTIYAIDGHNIGEGGFDSVTSSLISDLVNGNPRAAIETRPINYSVRIWQRSM